jgi:hypothetical protein
MTIGTEARKVPRSLLPLAQRTQPTTSSQHPVTVAEPTTTTVKDKVKDDVKDDKDGVTTTTVGGG